MTASWQPTASIEGLRKRAALVHSIREFFALRGVLEVETPSLSKHTITDPYLDALAVDFTEPGAAHTIPMFLQTSPEYAMKRLLAAGSGDIYQICKAFRDDEIGRLHNPEFTMLEWYRVGFCMQQLIDEAAALLISVLPVNEYEQFSYCGIFQRVLNIDPFDISLVDLIDYCHTRDLGDYAESLRSGMQINELNDSQNLLKDGLLQVLFNRHIEPFIGIHHPAIVTHFPASQASLACLSDDGKTANRFEIYFKGIELANGFEELTEPNEQKLRFEQDNLKREALGKSQKNIDHHFIQALESGLPKCSGIAVGLDRLVMLASGKQSVKDVISFNHENC